MTQVGVLPSRVSSRSLQLACEHVCITNGLHSYSSYRRRDEGLATATPTAPWFEYTMILNAAQDLLMQHLSLTLQVKGEVNTTGSFCIKLMY